MKNTLLLFYLLLPLLCFSQINIQGNVTSPEGYAWAMLYQYNNGEESLVSKSPINTAGDFKIVSPDVITPGIYKLVYHIAKKQSVDLLLENGKEVCIKIDPFNYNQLVSFCGTSLNTLLQEYNSNQLPLLQNIEQLYGVLQNYTKQRAFYTTAQTEYHSILTLFNSNKEKYSKHDTLLNSYIQYTTPYFSDPTQHPALQQYDHYQHYWKNLSAIDSTFINSPFLNQKVINYLMLRQDREDPEEQIIKNYQQAIDSIMQWSQPNETLQSKLAYFMSEGFKQLDLPAVRQYIDENHLSKQCDANLDTNLQERLDIYERLAIGNTAPNFKTPLQNNPELHSIKADYTVIIFWGSWCGHCKTILPGVHQYLSKQDNITVIALGLDEGEEDWKQEKIAYPNWKHQRLAEKWEHKIAKDYGIYATPTFFVLDKDKKILGKCKSLLEIKKLL